MQRLFVVLMVFLAVCSVQTVFGQQHIVKPKPAKKPSAKKEIKKHKEDNTEAEPEDTVKVTFGRDIVDLRTLNGWIKDDRDKWVHTPNRIPFENPDFNNQLYTRYKIGYENIRQINIVEVKIDSAPYLAFIIEQDKGFYKDSAHEDFKYYVAADYFLIKPSDFIKLWNDSLKIGQPYEATMKAYYSGLVGYKDIKLRPKYMAMEINKDIRNRKFTDTSVKIYLQFGMKPVQNKKGKFMRFYYGLAYARTGEQVSDFDFDVFSKRFYETDLDLFHRFSRPKSLRNIKPEYKVPLKKTESKKQPAPEKDYDNIVD